MAPHHKILPIDAEAAAALAAQNLDLTLVDTDDEPLYTRWVQADNRGFHGSWLTDDEAASMSESMRERRTTGVYDATGADPQTPVATVNAWPITLTVPGARELSVWGISSVTVAPTHRRKGIARNLLESELRAAVALGLPIAALTVSEATIYDRFGFAPAAMAADLEIDTRRARFTGPAARGRVQFVPREQLRREVDVLIERARLQHPGDFAAWPVRWDSIFGLTPSSAEEGKKLRAVRYDDEDGAPQGFALYSLKEHEHDFARHTASVAHLLALTPDAYAGLWQHLLELDLTATVKATLRSVDEPLRWMVADHRAITATHHDHLWLRILDVPAALGARSYSAPLDTVISVTDNLGFAGGTYRVRTSLIEPVEITRTEDAPALTLSINDLSALYLGGVSAETLRAAGRVTEHAPGAATALDVAFRSPVEPWLSVWF